MISKYRFRGLTAIIAGAFLTAVLAQSAPQNVASGQRQILLQTTQSWNGKPYTHYPTGQPQLTTIRLTIPPHTDLPWHTHPIPNVVYVLSGTLTLHDKASGKTLVVHQGQAVGESVDDIHRGESGDEPTELLITYAGTPGVPTSVPAKERKRSTESGCWLARFFSEATAEVTPPAFFNLDALVGRRVRGIIDGGVQHSTHIFD